MDEERKQAPPELLPCPDHSALARIVAQTLGEQVAITACKPGHFPTPGWFVHAWNGDAYEGSGGLYRLVLDGASREVIAKDYLSMGPRDRMDQGISIESINDFDDNGIDEIIEMHESSPQGIIHNSLVALLLSGNRFDEALSIMVEYDDSGFHLDDDQVTTCKSSRDVTPPQGATPRTLVITGKIQQGARAFGSTASECISGRRELVLMSGKFVAR